MSHDRFQMVNSGGGSYYKISYELEMRLDTAISFRLIFQGAFLTTCCLGTVPAADSKQEKPSARLLPIMAVRRCSGGRVVWILSSLDRANDTLESGAELNM